MKEFIAKYADQITGVISGFDRLVLRGTLRAIVYERGMRNYLWENQVLLKDFAHHVLEVSSRLKKASLASLEKLGRTVKYLASSQTDKEAIARSLATQQGITEGPICVLTCVEPCSSFEVHRNRETKKLELVSRLRKCLFLYHYSIHPVLGFMNARIQTWFPFPIQICLNGREWLARQMDAEGLDYTRCDNCFPWIEDSVRAQALMKAQLRVNWPKLLEGIACQLNPLHDELFRHFPVHYYWSTHQSEWATDIVFREAAVLKRLHPILVRQAMTTLGSVEVMRFLGRKIPSHGGVHGRFQGQVVSDIQQRPEGIRIKHRVNENSVKLYDKAYTERGSVLRVEVTMNQVEDFKVYRPKEGEPHGPLAWRTLRRGIADLHRRAEVSQKGNDRYLAALASVDDSATLQDLTQRLERPKTWKRHRVRALHPFSDPDCSLLQAVSRGEFTLHGFRNHDLQRLLFAQPADSREDKRRRSAWVSRQVRLLRAHGLIHKVAHENRYHVTRSGRKAITAILAARQATVSRLTSEAA